MANQNNCNGDLDFFTEYSENLKYIENLGSNPSGIAASEQTKIATFRIDEI